jgi:hypothetical protein
VASASAGDGPVTGATTEQDIAETEAHAETEDGSTAAATVELVEPGRRSAGDRHEASADAA